ncbi:MAG: hypothetical protein LUG98_14160, partial [Tannerellaceae bacterium]|nr:hypothetical protein [Tannerellaceae bacterium]
THNRFVYEAYSYDSKLATALCLLFKFIEVKAIADFACGPGFYVKTFREAGFECEGYDRNPFVRKLSSFILNGEAVCSQIDLLKSFQLESVKDVIVSLEGAECVPVEFEDVYISNLIKNSRKYVVLGWATTDSGKEEYINCRNNEYAIQKMAQHGYSENIFAKNYLRSAAELEEFKKSIMVFQK